MWCIIMIIGSNIVIGRTTGFSTSSVSQSSHAWTCHVKPYRSMRCSVFLLLLYWLQDTEYLTYQRTDTCMVEPKVGKDSNHGRVLPDHEPNGLVVYIENLR